MTNLENELMRNLTQRTLLRLSVLGAVSVLWFPNSALASTSGVPWEEPLQVVATSVSGPVAQSVIIIAIVILGFSLAFSEGPVLRRVLGVILGGALAAAAASFTLSFFGFAGGATF